MCARMRVRGHTQCMCVCVSACPVRVRVRVRERTVSMNVPGNVFAARNRVPACTCACMRTCVDYMHACVRVFL